MSEGWPITVVYVSRFGTTARLARQLAAGLAASGAAPQLIDVSSKPTVPQQPLVLLTPIIWDRPIPAMRDWITANAGRIQQHVIASGVVCGAAGVRETGGMVYARQLAKRIGRPDVFQFALSGEIPSRDQLRGWEWRALKIFAGIMRQPKLFTIRADEVKARKIGSEIASLTGLRARVE
jgi:hypothetical protein